MNYQYVSHVTDSVFRNRKRRIERHLRLSGLTLRQFLNDVWPRGYRYEERRGTSVQQMFVRTITMSFYWRRAVRAFAELDADRARARRSAIISSLYVPPSLDLGRIGRR